MNQPGEQFSRLLTAVIKELKQKEDKNISIIQDELGYALGKKGGAIIEYWRKGNLPSKYSDFEKLMTEITARSGLDRDGVEAFCDCYDFPFRERLLHDLFDEKPLRLSTQPQNGRGRGTNQKQALSTAHPEISHLPDGSIMPLRRNPFFVGRTQDLRQIEAAFNDGHVTAIGQVQVAAATGIGGIGKSQLACEFVYQYSHLFPGGVFWLNFEDENAVPVKIAECGGVGRLNLHPNFSTMPLQDQINLVVAAWNKPTSRLLIFDNCESEQLLQEWLPKSGGCHVIVTSRRGEWDPILKVKHIKIGTLYSHESISLLRHLSGINNEDTLEAIANELGHLPLALHLGGKYLKKYQAVITADKYLAELRHPNVLEHPSLKSGGLSPTGHEQYVWRTFALSFDKLCPTDPIDQIARQLLVRAAHFAPGEPIWRKLLVKTLDVESSKESELDVQDGFERLIELGLIDVEDHDILKMHRLIGAFVRDVAREQVQTTLELVETVVFEEASRVNEAGFPIPLLEWNLHLRSVTTNAAKRQDERGAYLCSAVGEHLRQLGDFQGAKDYFELSLGLWRQLIGEHDARTAEGFHQMGRILRDLGELEEAKGFLERALQLRQEILGEQHPHTAVSFNEMGRWHFNKRDFVSAEACLRKAVDISITSLGHNHVETADYLNNLGMCLSYSNRNPEALPFLQDALRIRRQILGEYHPRTALSLNNMGYLMQELQRYEDAKPYYERALEIRLTTLGDKHKDSAECFNNLGVLHNDLKEYAKARPILEKAVRIYEYVYGSYHARLATALFNLGLSYHHLHLPTEALQCLERSLKIRQKIFGSENPLTQRVHEQIEKTKERQ